MDQNMIPITERSNEITEDIDCASAEEIVQLLYNCNLEIFNGWGNYKNILSPDFVSKIYEISAICAEYVNQSDAGKSGIILSGCGTSGRLAFLLCQTFNKLSKEQCWQPCYHYLISGGDHALMMSVEYCEDDWSAGKSALAKIAAEFQNVLFIGITCGLSAPFVGGQIEFCMQNLKKFTPYLLGFNPSSQARVASIDGTERIMQDVAMEMEAKGYLLNPVIGPEPITGSSRMKGGTVTKMILETLFFLGHKNSANEPNHLEYSSIINMFKVTLDVVHTKYNEIASLVRMAGSCLVRSGTVSYVSWCSQGVMGLIDAVECVPTFGANVNDFQCFLKDGFKNLRYSEDLITKEEEVDFNLKYFMQEKCPQLSKNDTVIFVVESLSDDEITEFIRISQMVLALKANIALVAVNTLHDIEYVKDILHQPLTIHINLPQIDDKLCCKFQQLLPKSQSELALKLIFNAISTGAHILKGKVYKNCMIDLKLTNGKLFDRGVRIVRQFSSVNEDKAKECLLKSIYRKDDRKSENVRTSSEEGKRSNIYAHTITATKVEKVIPLAILIAKGFQVPDGLKLLEDCPIVRQCLDVIY